MKNRVIRNIRSIDAPIDGLRRRDANNGSAGEWPAGVPRPGGVIPTSGGINPQQDPEEEYFARDRRRARHGWRDEEGEHWGIEIYGPYGGTGFGSSPATLRATDAARDRAALHNLENRGAFDDVAANRGGQWELNNYWLGPDGRVRRF